MQTRRMPQRMPQSRPTMHLAMHLAARIPTAREMEKKVPTEGSTICEDPIWHTWRAARQSAALSAHHLGRLRYRLEQRAGISVVGTEDELEASGPDHSQAGAFDGET